jgi:hypothetical protein
MKKTKLDKIYELRDALVHKLEYAQGDLEMEDEPEEMVKTLVTLSNDIDDMLGELDIDTY